MSLEQIIHALESLGLSNIEAEVYVFVARKGQINSKYLEVSLKYSKDQIDNSLDVLFDKGLVNKKQRTIISAIPFDEALELLIKNQRQEEISLKKLKKKLINSWKKNSYSL